jgi:hypothetical protein
MLPTADQWEMAARGPDGRRHPRGNGYEGLHQELESPWGVKQLFGIAGQWTLTKSTNGHPIVVGNDRQLRCAGRSEIVEDEYDAHYAIRLVIKV